MMQADRPRSISDRPRSVRPLAIRTVADLALEHGLTLASQGNGRHYTTCPECSQFRSAAGRKLKCLSILIDNDGLCWRCHHCDWHGGAFFSAPSHRAAARTGRHHLRTRRELGVDDLSRLDLARGIWERAVDAVGSPADAYMRSRGIAWPLVSWARFHAACPRGRAEVPLPALIAAVTVPTTRQFRAVHRIFLRGDSAGKADLPRDQQKRSLGPTSGAAVVLGNLDKTADAILEGEGIETTLSACMALDQPGIATLSASTLGRAPLPVGRAVVVLADRGAKAAAEQGARLRLAEGRRVLIAVPPDGAKDFNDLLRDCGDDAVRAALLGAHPFSGRT